MEKKRKRTLAEASRDYVTFTEAEMVIVRQVLDQKSPVGKRKRLTLKSK